jgi:hypothetical protein
MKRTMKRTLLALALVTIAGAASAQDVEPRQPAAQSARHDIERAGYRDVRGLAQDSQGVWHGRALRGNTEVQLLVHPDGNVSVNR